MSDQTLATMAVNQFLHDERLARAFYTGRGWEGARRSALGSRRWALGLKVKATLREMRVNVSLPLSSKTDDGR
jgi:hypothetical protein